MSLSYFYIVISKLLAERSQQTMSAYILILKIQFKFFQSFKHFKGDRHPGCLIFPISG